MGYMDIENLYKNQDILLFKECYASEKIHGTSAHIGYKNGNLTFFAGGGSHIEFLKLFDEEKLKSKLNEIIIGEKTVTIFGEYYGGKMQGMKNTYGSTIRFIVFDVQIENCWLNTLKAEKITTDLGLEFVHYIRIPTTLEAIEEQKNADSVQAVRNGCGLGHMREGIVLRPIEEFIKNDGSRVIAKHKRDEFRETSKPRPVIDPTKLEVLTNAKAIADEWVTKERLNHILTKGLIVADIKNTGSLIQVMVEDILRESKGEIVDSKEVRQEIARSTALMFKDYLKSTIKEIDKEKN